MYVVSGQYSDVINAKLTGYMSIYYMSVGKLDLKCCIRHSLNYFAVKFNNIIFWQNNPSYAFYFLKQ